MLSDNRYKGMESRIKSLQPYINFFRKLIMGQAESMFYKMV